MDTRLGLKFLLDIPTISITGGRAESISSQTLKPWTAFETWADKSIALTVLILYVFNIAFAMAAMHRSAI